MEYKQRTTRMTYSYYFVQAIYFLVYSLVPIASTNGIFGLFPNAFPQIYHELNPQWYQDIGYLVCMTMIFNIFVPPIFFIGKWLVFRAPARLKNREYWESKTLWKYVQTFSGPEFRMDYQYAHGINLIFMTFLFGPQMPIIFILGLAGIISHYITESLAMAYAYQKPVTYDHSIHEVAFKVLNFMPLVYCCSAALVYSNPSVFKYEYSDNLFERFVQQDASRARDFINQFAPGSLLLLMLMVQILMFILYRPGLDLTRHCCDKKPIDSQHSCLKKFCLRIEQAQDLSVNRTQSYYEFLPFTSIQAQLDEIKGSVSIKSKLLGKSYASEEQYSKLFKETKERLKKEYDERKERK